MSKWIKDRQIYRQADIERQIFIKNNNNNNNNTKRHAALKGKYYTSFKSKALSGVCILLITLAQNVRWGPQMGSVFSGPGCPEESERMPPFFFLDDLQCWMSIFFCNWKLQSKSDTKWGKFFVMTYNQMVCCC